VVLAQAAGLSGPPHQRASPQIPPSIEFRVPKAPTVMSNDSGAALVYGLHLTNLSVTPYTLARVELLRANGQVIHSTPLRMLNTRKTD
jgi:hypothetical protein